MRSIFIIFFAAAVILSSGCMMTDVATGEWKKESLSTQEKLTINSDGTFFMSGLDGEKTRGGEWNKINDRYEFVFEEGKDVEYAEICQGRAEFIMIFDNATYTKI